MKLVLLAIFYIVAPYLILLLTKRYKILDKIGAVLLCYALGFILGLADILPTGSEKVQEIITTVTIPLALPLLLFGTNIKEWFHMAGKTMISMLLAMVSLVALVVASFNLFGSHLDDSWQIGGLLVGLYSGGTPNLASIQAALGVSPEIYLMVNTYDIVLSSIFLLIIMSTGGKLLSWLLPKYKKKKTDFKYQVEYNGETPDPYDGFFRKPNIGKFMFAMLASVTIAALSVGLSFLITGKISMLIVILGITSFSIVGSFIPQLNKPKKNFEGGMYLILVFSIAVASMVNLEDFINISPSLFWFISCVLFGTFLLHIILSAIFKIDSDTTLIVATAMICSPPFVPVVAGTLKNREIIISGLSVGIIGYAIGNYLGVAIAYLLKGFL